MTATPAVILLAALPWGARTAAGIIAGAESQGRFREMRNGMHPDRAMVLRARIEMASPNLQLRDPAIYRIRHAAHHRTGEKWRVYPTYIYAHPIEDALENITHSFARLEFA